MGGSNGQLCGKIHQIISIRKNHFLHVSVKHKKGKTIKNWFSHLRHFGIIRAILHCRHPISSNEFLPHSFRTFCCDERDIWLKNFLFSDYVSHNHSKTIRTRTEASLRHVTASQPHPPTRTSEVLYLSVFMFLMIPLCTDTPAKAQPSPARPSLSLCHLETI